VDQYSTRASHGPELFGGFIETGQLRRLTNVFECDPSAELLGLNLLVVLSV
jgi:hypothetical protein